MIENMIKNGRLPVGTRVLFTWNGELVTGRVLMSHRYWNGALLVQIPEDVISHYPRFCGKKVLDIPRKSVRIMTGR